MTAIATYALLAAGESPQDKRVQQAIEFLRKANITGVYAMGIRANVWDLIPQNATVQQSVRDDVIRLGTSAANHKPKGLYHYSITNTNSYDLSASQYGVLGMWALNQTGFDVPRAYWEWVDGVWKQKQRPDGGWAYNDGAKESTASMTAAGVATLFITQDYLYSSAGINCQGNITNLAIEKGLEWMSKNFNKVSGPYTWYGIERIGVASGYKYFGTTNWYQEGANSFVKSQSKVGSWESHGAIPGTSFGILFLVRGRAPVVMNKLQYDIGQKGGKSEVGHWNERPRDVANVTKYIAKNLEKDLNWQIVNLKVDVEEFHDAPILYLSGNQALNFTEDQEAKLKQFVEQGGMIFANADCGSSGGRTFTQSFIKLGQKLFPYEFRELPADHVIYTREQFPRAKWRNPPSVMGLSNGVRELMLLVPTADPARTWQINILKGKEDLYQLMANIFLYAVDKGQGGNLRYKGQTYIVNPNPKIKASSTLKLARIQYEGNWNPEPAGWRRMSAILHNDSKIDLVVDPVKAGEGKLAGHKVAHLTGTTKFTLPQAAKDELKKFVENGGTLIVDAAGGSPEFAHAAETMLGEMFPEHAQDLKTALKQDNPVYTLGGESDIQYRAYARQSLNGSLSVGRLRGILFGKRLGVIFSREDLSAGLVGEPMDGILGYDPKTATQLMQNILLYAQNPNAAPPAAKAEKKEAAK
jgi:hypothetical protein